MRKFYDNPTFLTICPLLLVLAILVMTHLVHKSKEAAANAEYYLKKQAWCMCGKPYGEPCNCPPEGCVCGIVEGKSCPNCRPMK